MRVLSAAAVRARELRPGRTKSLRLLGHWLPRSVFPSLVQQVQQEADKNQSKTIALREGST